MCMEVVVSLRTSLASLGSPGHVSDRLCLAWVHLPKLGVASWLCHTGMVCQQVGKPTVAMVSHVESHHQWGKNMSLLEPWCRETSWGGGITSCLLSWASAGQRCGCTALSLEDVPGKAFLWPLLARLCLRPELLLGGTTRGEWLPTKRRRVKATQCTMMFCHLLPGLGPDAGFNLP